MLWSEKCLHLPMRLHSRTPTQLVYFRYITLMFGGEFFGWNIVHSTVRCWEVSIQFFVVIFGHYILFGQDRIYIIWTFGFKFAMTVIWIQFTFITVASGWLCFVMSLCIPYVCIVSLCVFACISTCALGILKACFIDEPQTDKVTVYLVIFTTAI